MIQKRETTLQNDECNPETAAAITRCAKKIIAVLVEASERGKLSDRKATTLEDAVLEAMNQSSRGAGLGRAFQRAVDQIKR